MTALLQASLYQVSRSLYYHLKRYLPTYTSEQVKFAWLERPAQFPCMFLERNGAEWTPAEMGRVGFSLREVGFTLAINARTSIQRDELAAAAVSALTRHPIAVLEMTEQPYLDADEEEANPEWDWDEQGIGYAHISRAIASEASYIPGGPRAQDRYVEIMRFDAALFEGGSVL